MVNKIGQTEKDKFCVVSSYVKPRGKKWTQKNKVERWLLWSWGVREMGRYWRKGTNFQL